MASLQTARSFLFAPGSEERKLVRALESGADAVVADLEDAVAPAEKAAARDLTTRLVAEIETNAARLVRVNGVGTEWHDADVAAVEASAADGIVLPKATAAARRRRLRPCRSPDRRDRRDRRGAARGLRDRLARLRPRHSCSARWTSASSSGSSRATTGTRSSSPGRRSSSTPPRPVSAARSIASGWTSATSTGSTGDCVVGRSLGFRGKALVHPDQIAPTHEAFAPSADEVRRAREIVAAYERAEADGQGVVALDGEMIDAPVVERARELLSDEKRSVLHAE